MRPGWTAAAVTLAVTCLTGGTAATTAPRAPVGQSEDFVPGCTLPVAAIADHHSIDRACPIAEDTGEDAANENANPSEAQLLCRRHGR